MSMQGMREKTRSRLKKLNALLVSLLLLTMSTLTYGARYQIQQDSDLVGQDTIYQVPSGGISIPQLLRKTEVSYHEFVEANPQYRQVSSLLPHAQVLIPNAHLLPKRSEREGIVINLAELRLYFFPKDRSVVYTFPVALGRLGWRTPVGHYSVIRQQENPKWYPPQSIRQAYLKAHGQSLPMVVPPGKKNPLGPYAIYLSKPGYLIHGNADAKSIGQYSSSGCIRMYNKDIKLLYRLVSLGDPVRITTQHLKLGWRQTQLLLEAHRPVRYGSTTRSTQVSLKDQLTSLMSAHNVHVDWKALTAVVHARTGVPTTVGEKMREQ